MTRFELPRGMRDIEYEEYMLIEYARSKFVECCNLFGFNLMEPSPLEMLSTLEAKSGPMIKDEIYAFKDKGGRDVALRFDLTVGLTRYIASRRDVKIPAKLATFGSVWRYDEPQHGRYRWFHQWDIEIYDNFSIESDADIIEFVKRYFKLLGIDVSIQVSDRALMEQFIRERLKVKEDEKVMEMLRAVDKLSKKDRTSIIQEYASKGIDVDILNPLFDLADLKGSREILSNSEYLKGLDATRLNALLDSLNSRGIDVNINMGIVRGLDYYSSIVFEVYSNLSGLALVGGGRYDKLPSVFGRADIGATGAAGGVERIVALLREKGIKMDMLDSHKGIFIAYTSKELKGNAIRSASMLRDRGMRSECIDGSLKRQLEYASSKGYKTSIIFAEREFNEGYCIIRDMVTGKERYVRVEDLLDSISE